MAGQYLEDQWTMSASIGQQVFSVAPSLAGGLASFILATRLKQATQVKAVPLLAATLISSLVVFSVVFMITAAPSQGRDVS